MNEIFPEEQAIPKVEVTSKKPTGWSRHSNAPYFKAEYADQLKKWVDKQIETGGKIIYRWDRFPDISKNTLYHKVNQSIRFLIEQMDTADRKYFHWYVRVKVSRTEMGIEIQYRTDVNGVPDFNPELSEPDINKPVWKQQLDIWLESDNKQPFIRENLTLNPDEIKQLKTELSGLIGIMSSITSYSIKVIKT